MKISFGITFGLLFFSLTVFAGGPIDDNLHHEQRPNGGFHMDRISGTWECEELGKLILQEKENRIHGFFLKNGKIVSGTVNGHIFSGKWTHKKTNRTGTFQLSLSIERKSPYPTHMRGHWKKNTDKSWSENKWICKR